MDEYRPDVVFLDIGLTPKETMVIDGRRVDVCDPAWGRRYQERTGALVDLLTSTGARVGVATAMHHDRNTLTWPLSREDYDDLVDCVNTATRTFVRTHPSTFLIDVDGLVCPDRRCAQDLDGGPVRSDGIHLDPGPGGRRVATFVLDRLAAGR
jgi:hypothetical protein